ncbi:MAG: low molecular weight protein-tyrosine-phosphatase [Gammaproteobacteria bacterium]
MRLLVVCLGNICRSPMAEGALRARLAEAGLAGAVRVDSAGTGDWHVGQPPDRRAIACARRHGVDIAGLRARQLRRDDHHAFDWLLCADGSVLREVRRRAPGDAGARSALLLPWAREGASGPAAEALAGDDDLADPYTGADDDFEQVWQRVDAAARAIAQRLRAAPPGSGGA